jgi:hypothetical protein
MSDERLNTAGIPSALSGSRLWRHALSRAGRNALAAAAPGVENRCRTGLWVALAVWILGVCGSSGQPGNVPLVQRLWFETRTVHFTIYSCGSVRDVYRLSARLEEFCEAYTLLAGARALASPPIVVMAFPDHESMKPFLPLYQGQPGNIAGFFKRSGDENLIVLSLPGPDSSFEGMEVIFHEYTHLLFRHNDPIWPLWLKEGMAEIY